MSWYLYFLWLVQVPLSIFLMALMVRRGLHRQFRFFFAYILEVTLAIVVFFFIYHAAKYWHVLHITWGTYGYGYFGEEALNTALRFGVIYEIFAHVFDSYPALQKLRKPVFRWALLLLLAIGLVVAAFTRGHDRYFSMYAMHVLEQTASILQVGLLMVLFLFSAYAGLSWRNFVFGIGLGLGIYACIKLAAAALQAVLLLPDGSPYVNAAVMGAFDVADVIWIVYLLMPEDRPQATPPGQNIDDWKKELQRLS
jgi:hypothetical protein